MPPETDQSSDPQRRLDPYAPRVLLRQLAQAPDEQVHVYDATLLFADVSGFTALSERLARHGREGAERLADAIGGAFETLLRVAYDNGGGLLKLAGDALVLFFEGDDHEARACRAAFGMRGRLREIGRQSGGQLNLRMSQGLSSGEILLLLVGDSHREQLVLGPVASTAVRMEKLAAAGEILLSPATADAIPRECLGARREPGFLLADEPSPVAAPVETGYDPPSLELVASCIPTMVRAHVLSGRQPSEHRNVTIAFLGFDGIDELIAAEGSAAAAEALHELVADVQRAADEYEVCFLESDVSDGGGALMLTAGAPRIVGDDEERMLLALTRIRAGRRRLAVRIGVNRGNVFAGDIGPYYRRAYSVMGDAVNLAARVMSKAPPGELYATAQVLDRSPTRFTTTALAPLSLKGKAKPVQVWAVGEPVAGRSRQAVAVRFPLVGRDAELATLTGALADAGDGRGSLVDITGEPGVGKSRLVDELIERAGDVRTLTVTCEAFTVSTPYIIWRSLLREAIGAGWEDSDAVVLRLLRSRLKDRAPQLLPWLGLLGPALDIDAPASPQVERLASEFRRLKLHEVVIDFLRALLTEPVAIVIDDAQFVDEASGDLLDALARELETLPWLVLLSRREGGRYRPAPAPSVTHVEPTPLDPEATLALAEVATDAQPLKPHVLTLAAERSGGNPQFLRDLLRAAAEGSGELPESLEAAAMSRIDSLAPDDRTLVRRASVMGLTFHERVLPVVLGDAVPPPTGDTWDRLAAFFARDDDGYVRFRRAIVRDAAYEGLAYSTRRRLHEAAGLLLEQEYGAMLDEVGGMLSLHFQLAGDHERTWRYARAAAVRAQDHYAFAAAADLWVRALEAARALSVPGSELAPVWEQLGEARAHAGDLIGASQAFTRALKLGAGDPVRDAHLVQRQAHVHERVGRMLAATRAARRGLRLLDGVEGARAATVRARLVTTLGAVRQRQGRSAEAARLCREAIAAAEETGEELVLARACFLLDWVLVDLGRADEAVYSDRALEIYTRAGDLDSQAAVLNNLGMFAYWEGRWDDAALLYRRGAEASTQAGDISNAAFGECNLGEVLADQGHHAQAKELLRRARRVWRGTDDAHGVAFASALLGRLAARAGRVEEGLELLATARSDLGALGIGGDAALADGYHAEALALGGDAPAAMTAARRLLAADDRSPLLWRVRGIAHAQLGEPAEAREALLRSLELARDADQTYEAALTIAVLAQLGDPADQTLRAEGEAMLAELGVERVPAPPLGP